MKLTASMKRFLKDDILPHYVLYSKADNYAYCTYCQHEVTVDLKGSKPLKQITCPSCKRTVTMKAKGQTKHSFFDTGVGIILENIDSFSLIVHYFDVEKTYKPNGSLAYFDLKECLRETFDIDGLSEAWDNAFAYGWKKCNIREYANYKGCAGEPCYHINTNWKNVNVYTKNLKNIIVGTPWEHSCMDKIFNLRLGNIPWYTVRGFLQEYTKTQIDEYLYKVGFYNLTKCSVFGYLPCRSRENTLPEMLVVSRENWKKLLAKKNPTYDDLRMYQRMSQYNFTENDYEIFKKYFEESWYYDKFGSTKYDGFKKIFPKSLYQFGKYADTIPNFDLKFYEDYLNMCIKLKDDLSNTFVLFPKDLNQAHDLAVTRWNIKEEKRKKRERKKQNKDYEAFKPEYIKKYSFSNNKFSIVIPSDCEDICKEGQALHHCVGTYIDKVAKGKSIILFVRKNDNLDKSYYTMEIVDDRVVQCRGYKNDSCTEEVKKFLRAFARKQHVAYGNVA